MQIWENIDVEFVILLLLAGAVAYLWQRADRLESRLNRAEDLIDLFAEQVPQQDGAKGPQPEAAAAKSAPIPNKLAIAAMRIDPEQVVQRKPAEAERVYLSAQPEMVAKKRRGPKLPSFKFDFEDLFGRLLPIWAGGITLAVAGFFLVKFSIEQGLLGPQIRVALGFLFGGLLLGGAETAYRQEYRLSDPRVRQALAGAGLATLYASFYLAGSMYGLVGNAIAFLGLAGVTGAAILLSFRFGLPSAILGLVGGFAAPMLVGSEEANLPVLALYLALITGGLTYAGNRQGRSWLVLATLAGGLGWGVLILLSGVTGFTDILAFGGYLVVMGAFVPAFTDGRDAAPWLRIGAAALAALQMAAMVAQADYSMLAWGLYGLLAATLAFFAWRDQRLRSASAFAAGLGAAMLATWFDSTPLMFAIVGSGLTAIFAVVPLANIWRGAHHKIDAYQLGGFSLAMIALLYGHFSGEISQNIVALTSLAIAFLPALGAFLLWPSRDEKITHGGIVTLSSAAIGIAVAGLMATPLWVAPLVVSAVTLGLITLIWKRDDEALNVVQWIATAAVFMALFTGFGSEQELERLTGIGSSEDWLKAVLRWIATAAPFAALALRKRAVFWTDVAEASFVLLAYGVLAQVAPGDALAWIAAAGAIVLTVAARDRFTARLTAIALTAAWAAEPIAEWLIAALFATVSEPMLIAEAIGWKVIALQLTPVLAAGATIVPRPPALLNGKLPIFVAASGAIAVIIGHLVFKQGFALETLARFDSLGFAERTIWQALLMGGALSVAKFVADKAWAKPVSLSLAVCAILHFTLFTLGWHNPLWDQQAVGAWPIANLLLPAYGIALGAIWWLSRELRDVAALPQQMFDGVAMVLIGLFTLSELRHAFAGTILVGEPIGQTEDLLRSLLGIVLAIGFLAWGARQKSRIWRIGSLVLMLGAVLKVFLLDANGLDGLVRVGSFVALGFSLIGIGWFYARQLAPTRAAED